jgi:hypothetical protein
MRPSERRSAVENFKENLFCEISSSFPEKIFQLFLSPFELRAVTKRLSDEKPTEVIRPWSLELLIN